MPAKLRYTVILLAGRRVTAGLEVAEHSSSGYWPVLFSLLTLVDPSMQCGCDLGRYGRWNGMTVRLPGGSVMIRAANGGSGRDSWND
jgi:hypothetical protein